MKLEDLRPATWQARLGQMERSSAGLAGLGVLMPLLAAMQPVQPIRALAAASVLMLLPGIAVARLLRLDDAILFLAVAPSVSLALTVLTSTGLMYAGIWSWQLTLVLLGVVTAAVAAVTGLADVPS
ncbi:MAG: hypothetical protein JWO11_1153 [Nocardioides sp.]|nr:hypothetical protein [Nocardioides sp.]